MESKRLPPRSMDFDSGWKLWNFASFRQVYDQRFQAKYGFWRPVVGQRTSGPLGVMIERIGDLLGGVVGGRLCRGVL